MPEVDAASTVEAAPSDAAPFHAGSFTYVDLLPTGPDPTEYRLLTTEGVSTVQGPGGRTFLQVEPEALRLLTDTAMHDIAHQLRPAHLAQLRAIVDDPEASADDRFVSMDLLRNACASAAACCRCARTPARGS